MMYKSGRARKWLQTFSATGKSSENGISGRGVGWGKWWARRARYPETRNILPLGAKFAEQPPTPDPHIRPYPTTASEENV